MEGDDELESSDSQGYSEESYGESSGYNYDGASEVHEGATDDFVNPFATEYTEEERSESVADQGADPEYSASDAVFGWESSYVAASETDHYVNSFGIDEEEAFNYDWSDGSYDSSEFYESFFGDSYEDLGWDSEAWLEEGWADDDWFSEDWLSEGGYSDDWLDAGGYGDEENFFDSENADGGGWFNNLDPNSPLSLAMDDDNSSLSLAMDDPNSMISQALDDPNSYFSQGLDDPNSELGQLLRDPNALATIDFTDPDSFIAKFFGS